MKPALALATASLRGYMRDRAAIGWTLLFPAGLLALFAILFSAGAAPKYTLGWFDTSGTQAASQLRADLSELGVFTIEDEASAEAATQRVESAKTSAGLILSLARDGGWDLHVELVLPPATNPVSGTIAALVQSVLEGRDPAQAGLELVNVQQQALSPIALLLPSILAMALMQLGVYSSVTLVQQRERDVLKRLATAPIRRLSVVTGFVGSRLVVAVMQAAVLLIAGKLLFGVELGGILAVAALVLLVAATFIAIGFALAGLAKTEEAATQMAGLVTVPLMFLSGLFIPLDQLPDVVRPIAALMPLTYAADALRGAMTGVTLSAPIGISLLALAVWLVGSLLIATKLFRWQ